MERSPHLVSLPDRYLFSRIADAKRSLLARNPTARLLSLGIGDTTEPLIDIAAQAMADFSAGLGKSSSYSGYGPSEGWLELRSRIAAQFYGGRVEADEIFVSDGAKGDLARLALLLGPARSVAVQDPSYPVYLDVSHLMGHEVKLVACTPENDFFAEELPAADVLYLCSPNNPTGHALTTSQLEAAIRWAQTRGSLILFDAAYGAYIRADRPRSIFSLPGACEVAIEVNSFSKLAGFTGVRLGWTVVPRALRYRCGQALHRDWSRLVNTVFNGPSNVAQAGGLACLSPSGWKALQGQLELYLENASKLRAVFTAAHIPVYGGIHAPFVWAHFPQSHSWDLFHHLLEEAHLVTVPGAGFGQQGESYLRLSSFGTPDAIEEATIRLRNCLPLLRELRK
jgi:LL-diaminopimelate aminotransferase